MTYSPSRGRIRKKWAVDKNGGPQLFLAELIQKKLIQHCWPCSIKDVEHTVIFKAARFRTLYSDFDDALEIAARNICAQYRVNYTCYNRGFRLIGEYTLSPKGVIKPCSNLSTSENNAAE